MEGLSTTNETYTNKMVSLLKIIITENQIHSSRQIIKWGFIYSRTWRCAAVWVFMVLWRNVVHSSSRVKSWRTWFLTFLQNVRNHSANDTMSHRRRPESSAILVSYLKSHQLQNNSCISKSQNRSH